MAEGWQRGERGGLPLAPRNRVTCSIPQPQGAKFAWESAGSGLEVWPEAIYGTQEIHVNGAVVLAFQLYYHTTQVSCHCAHRGDPPHCMTACLGQSYGASRSPAFIAGRSEGWALTRNAVTSGS